MSHSCEETYDVYRETVRRARKQHECDACRAPIRPGDYYCAVSVVHDNVAETVKRCGACQRTHEHLRVLCSERSSWDRENFWPDERLNCGLEYDEEWGSEPPNEIASLPLLGADERGVLLKPVARV